MRFIAIFKDSFQYERYAFVNFVFIAFLDHKFILQVLRITVHSLHILSERVFLSSFYCIRPLARKLV